MDVPEALVAAARGGSLVLFVGAGASKDPPSNLPDFRGLTRSITEEAQLPFEETELDNPDRLLGRVEAARVDVHQRVRSHLDVAGSSPNALHQAIVILANATKAPKIVTTNYDSHLTDAASAQGISLLEFMGPALPMGDDFQGVVYLHGSLRQDPRHLIATDADFGRAYLRDAWAARFLERMFAKFTVLFIGYSHGDVVMRYLARSLGPGSHRYAFTPTPDDADWLGLGIHPVAYDKRGSSHEALTKAVERWGSLLSMGALDHRQRIGQLVAAPPSDVPEETSYLLSTLRDEATARLFVELAHGKPWIEWLASQAEARQVFDGSGDGGTVWLLAQWFAKEWLADEETSRAGLGVLSASGGRLPVPLWNAVGQELHARQADRPTWLHPWLVFLVDGAPAGSGEWLEYALVASRFPDDRDTALLLLDFLVEPRLIARPLLGSDGQLMFEVEFKGSEFWLRDAWEKLFKPDLASVVDDLLAIADRHLRRARRLLKAAGAATETWDPVSFRRSSIAPHAQDQHGDKVGILIDIARDCLEFLAEAGGESSTIVEVWARSDAPILRRLAVHGVAIDARRSGDEKLAWLLGGALLDDYQLKHEVFELLAMALPSASEPLVDRLVMQVNVVPGAEIDDGEAYEAFNKLVWISEHSPVPSVSAALSMAKAAHPEFGVREHPDFNSWMEVGFRGLVAPLSAEDMHALLQDDRAAALSKLAVPEEARMPFDLPTAYDVIELVRQVVEEHPEDGFILLGEDPDADPNVVRGTLRGWGGRVLDDGTATRVIERLSSLDLRVWAEEVAWLLGNPGTAAGRTEWQRVVRSRELARDVASYLPASPLEPDGSDWLLRAINAPGGLLAEFWIHAVAEDWSSDREGWKGLDTASRGAIEGLLALGEAQGALAEVALASRLQFFHAADREWALHRVFPLLRWLEPERARRAWQGFLFSGRWSEQLLEDGLIDAYLDSVTHASTFSDDMRRRLAEHLAAVSLYAERDPATWVARFTRAAPEEVRVEWVDRVAWMLERLDPEARERQWGRWMRQYWKDRLASVPLELTPQEAGALAGWAVALDGSMDEAVELALRCEASLRPHGQVLRAIADRAERDAASCARLLGHLLTGTATPFWDCHLVDDVLVKVKGRAPEGSLRQIREQALRLGCRPTAED